MIALTILTLLPIAIIIGGNLSFKAETPSSPNDPNNSNTDTSDYLETFESPEGPLLVIPEAPLGIIGLFGACLLGLTVCRVKKESPNKLFWHVYCCDSEFEADVCQAKASTP